MHCPTCGSWTEVLETRTRANGTTHRRRECANGHRFASVEIASATYTRARPAILDSLKTIAARVTLWRRDAGIARDPRPSKELAAVFGLHFSRINKIRSDFRKDAAGAGARV
jgi:hypothetical protein